MREIFTKNEHLIRDILSKKCIFLVQIFEEMGENAKKQKNDICKKKRPEGRFSLLIAQW